MYWGTSKFLKIGFFILAALAIFPLIVMLLWNAVMPDVFGLGTINFWQALGLLILGKILFSSFGFGRGHHRGHHHWKSRWHNKWEKMTPEEQKVFYEKYGYWCGWRKKKGAEPAEEEAEARQA